MANESDGRVAIMCGWRGRPFADNANAMVDARIVRRAGLLCVLAAVAAAGCGPPPQLQASPAAVRISVKLGDDTKGPPPASSKLSFSSSKNDESLGWTLAGAPTWAQPSVSQGGTPADVDLKFDLAAMQYGANEVTIKVTNKETVLPIPVSYEVLGQLTIGPTQSVSLQGSVGQPKSPPVRLKVDSPVKPGLRWRARTDDPWLIVEPTEGTTPAEVTVSAALDKAASNSSGRIEFTADATWKGSPTVIPVVIEILNPDAIKKQIDAKLAMLKTEGDDTARDVRGMAAALKTSQGVDATISTFRQMSDRTTSGAKRIATLHEDLMGFLEQNAASEKLVSFAAARESATHAKSAADDEATRFRKCVDGIRISSFTIDSHAEWQESQVAVETGDLIAFEASGSWKLGFLAGTADAAGLGGSKYDAVSVNSSYHHGCLLLRVGETLVAGGAVRGLIAAPCAGKLGGRCNDQKYTDNAGAISVRVAVLPSLGKK